MSQAVILAGGKGTRLASRLGGLPKALVPVGGVPLLERQLRSLGRQGVDEALILVNHAADQIEDFVRGRDLGCRVRVIDDEEPRGTAGAVLACLDQLAERVFVVYGDTLFDLDIARFAASHAASGADATLLIHPNDHPADSDLVELNDAGFVTAFHPYPHPPGSELWNLVNAAFYLVERRALERWRGASPPLDFGKDLFPAMLHEGARLHGYVSFEYIKDLGTPKRLDKVEDHLRSGLVGRAGRAVPQAAVFLDRDGTLNALRDYVRTPEDLELIDGAAEAVRRFNDAEFRTVLVTNQPVLARGECSPEMLHRIHGRLSARLGQHGAYLDALYVCPHHPDSGFKGEVAALKLRCDCRKPEPGLFRRAMAELNIAADRSWMVGDSTGDMAVAGRLGLASVLVLTGEAGLDGKFPADPDFVARDIGAAARLITEIYPDLRARVSALLARLAPGSLILIGGPARTGKSLLAGVMRRELRRAGHACERIALDRWLRAEGARGEGVEGRFDLPSARDLLDPWLEGGALDGLAPCYDRKLRLTRCQSRLSATAEATVVLEGVPALLSAWLTSRPVLRIHVDAADDLRKQRVVDDIVARGLGDPAMAERVYDARERDEVALVRSVASGADLQVWPQLTAER